MAREEENQNTRGPNPPTPPVPPTPATGGRAPDIRGLELREDGNLWDGPTMLDWGHRKARAWQANQENLRAEAEQRATNRIPLIRDAERHARELEASLINRNADIATKQAQARMIEERLPLSIRILEERRAQAESEVPDDWTPEMRQQYIESRMSTPDLQVHFQAVNAASEFQKNNPGFIDPRAFAPPPTAGAEAVNSFVDQTNPDGSMPTPGQTAPTTWNRLPRREDTEAAPMTTLEKAQAVLSEMQARIPEGGTSQERRAWAEANGLAGPIIGMNHFIQDLTGPQPRAMNETVPAGGGFTPLPRNMMRTATGVPGGGTRVMDVPIAPDAPRFGVYQNADGTWTGLGASHEDNRGGFATEEEAKAWSIANFTKLPRTREEAGQTTSVASAPIAPDTASIPQRLEQGGIFGTGGVLRPTQEQIDENSRARATAISQGLQAMRNVGPIGTPPPVPRLENFRRPSLNEFLGPRMAGLFFGEDARNEAESYRSERDQFFADQAPRPTAPAGALASLNAHRQANSSTSPSQQPLKSAFPKLPSSRDEPPPAPVTSFSSVPRNQDQRQRTRSIRDGDNLRF